MTSKVTLEELLTSKLETIQVSTFLEPLTAPQTAMFKEIVTNLGVQADNTPDRKVSLVFRGDKLKNLANKLSTKGACLLDDKIPALLFYFGDKARQYYKDDDAAAKDLRWLTKIEDASEKTCSAIFENIQKVLAQPDFREPSRSDKDFTAYFSANNLSTFTSQLVNDHTARDYYLYFLHTAQINLGDNSFLVSTSLSYDVALEFSGGLPHGCVIYYVVPEPLEKFAVSHLRMQKYEPTLIGRGLPTYKGKTPYPQECEVAIRGALFSCFILGLRILSGNRFIVNPHLFSNANAVDSILEGLKIDQSDFEDRLNDTGYARGVGTRLDGNFHTIVRTSRTP